METDKITVLLIAGSGRSGSTLLDNVLGAVDGVFAAGELRFLWERGLYERRSCGCGVPVPDCLVWREILGEAFGGLIARDVAVAVAGLRNSTRVRHVPAMLTGRDGSLLERSEELRAMLARLYRAIATVTGCRVVVDSSKLPAYGYLLDHTDGIDLRVVHLVRDPRASAYSWSRAKELDDGADRRHMDQMGSAKSSALWSVWNATAATLWDAAPDRYRRLRYEELVGNPQAHVERILAFAGLPGAVTPFVDERTVVLGPNHSVAGNPDRFRRGTVWVAETRHWETHLSPRDRRVVGFLTAAVRARLAEPRVRRRLAPAGAA